MQRSTVPHPVTLRQLQYVVAVADLSSFGLAAKACRVSQPTLSAQVAAAEAALGVRLFHRDRRTVAPTRAGEVFVVTARALLFDADALVELAGHLADPAVGRLRIGVIPTVAPYLLPLVAPSLREAFPRLQVIWREEKTQGIRAAMDRGELDAGILVAEDAAPLAHVELGRDPFVLAVAPQHPLAASDDDASLDVLADEDVLLLDDGHCFRTAALAACASAGAHEADYRGTSIATLVQMAASGLGITLLPRLAVEVENRGSPLHVRAFVPGGPARTLVLAWRGRATLGPTAEPVGRTLAAAWAKARSESGDAPAR